MSKLDRRAGSGARIVTVHPSNAKQKCCPLQRDRSERRREEETRLSSVFVFLNKKEVLMKQCCN
jgi:hypothetical protein